MSTSSIVILIIVLALITLGIVAAIWISRRSAVDHDGSRSIEVSPKPMKISKKKHKTIVVSNEQITIFRYDGIAKISVCPLCDGENDELARYCHICGHSLKDKGAE